MSPSTASASITTTAATMDANSAAADRFRFLLGNGRAANPADAGGSATEVGSDKMEAPAAIPGTTAADRFQMLLSRASSNGQSSKPSVPAAASAFGMGAVPLPGTGMATPAASLSSLPGSSTEEKFQFLLNRGLDRKADQARTAGGSGQTAAKPWNGNSVTFFGDSIGSFDLGNTIDNLKSVDYGTAGMSGTTAALSLPSRTDFSAMEKMNYAGGPAKKASPTLSLPGNDAKNGRNDSGDITATSLLSVSAKPPPELAVKQEPTSKDYELPLGPSQTSAAAVASEAAASGRADNSNGSNKRSKSDTEALFQKLIQKPLSTANNKPKKKEPQTLDIFQSAELNERVDDETLLEATSGLLQMKNSIDLPSNNNADSVWSKFPAMGSLSVINSLSLPPGPAAGPSSAITPDQFVRLMSAAPTTLLGTPSINNLPRTSSIGMLGGGNAVSAGLPQSVLTSLAPPALGTSTLSSTATIHLLQQQQQRHMSLLQNRAMLGLQPSAVAPGTDAASPSTLQRSATTGTDSGSGDVAMSTNGQGERKPPANGSLTPSASSKAKKAASKKQSLSTTTTTAAAAAPAVGALDAAKGPRKPRKAVPEKLVFVEKTDMDVLFGRGGESNYHPGNKHYRQLVEESKPLYLSCDKNQKTKVAQAVVDRIHASGGRFLDKDKATGNWYVALNKVARTKVGQALRDRNTPEARAARRAKYNC